MKAWRQLAAGVGACVLVSCGGGGDDLSRETPLAMRGLGATYTVRHLVSDTAGAP